MSYAVYTTEGFILGSTPTGEASKMYWIYTRDFGLICAKAQGVRLVVSKLRYSLDEYSLATFSLVKGREVWRLTGAHDKQSPQGNMLIRARVLSLVRRLVQGQEKNERLFSTLLSLFKGDFVTHSKEEQIAFESLILIHVLSSLGYLDAKKFLGGEDVLEMSLSTIALIQSKKKEVIAEINKALKETQL